MPDDSEDDDLLILHLVDQTICVQSEEGVMHHVKAQQQASDGCLRMTRYCGAVIGCIVGYFLEAALLFLVDAKDQFNIDGFALLRSKDVTCISGFLLCSATTLMGVAACHLLRSSVRIVFAYIDEPSNDASVREDREQLTCKIVESLDLWYAVGCIFGMLGSWGITYAILAHMT
jgi:hypothetical protein